MRLYQVLERQVWDQIQRKCCYHAFRLHHGHHQKRYVRIDDRKYELYFD